jgi:hypothetical protein
MSEDNSNNQSTSMARMLRQTKLDYEGINNALLKNIEILDNENTQLKSALSELQTDLKEKENSIEESHKIITKLKEEYSKVIKEYQNVEILKNELLNENELNKKAIDNFSKSNVFIDKLQKKNEKFQNEIIQLRKENNSLRNNLISKGDETNKKEKDIKERELIINDLKERSDNWITMIKERENLINEQNKKIKELNDIISQKNEQLKVMVNFSKEINKENKTNINELTKQAVKTIKLFYNSFNNSNKEQMDNNYRISFKNSNVSFSDFENIFKNKKANFSLEDALNNIMYIPTDLKSISKEFLIDMNFKTELIKSELYSSLIREGNFISFLENVFSKLNIKDTQNLKNLCSKVIMLKTNYDMLEKENIDLKKQIFILLENKKQFDLYAQKLKDDMKIKFEKIKDKFNYIEKGMEGKSKIEKENNKMMKDKYKKETDKLKAEMIVLKSENNKLEKNNEDLKRTIEQLKENENFYKSIENPKINLNPYNTYNFNNWKNTLIPSRTINYNIISNIHSFPNKYNNNINYYNNYNTIQPNPINESFNESNYKQKKKEIKSLKEEIGKIKNEMNNLMLNPNNLKYNNLENNNSERNNYSLRKTPQKFYANNSNQNSYIYNNNPEMDIQPDTNTSINIMNEKEISTLKNLLNQEKEKNLLIQKELHNLKNYCDELEAKNFNKINSDFTPNLFVKMFFNINLKLFSSSELKKYYSLYSSNSINGIIEIFIKTCEKIKKQIHDSKFDIDSSYTDVDENLFNSRSLNLNNSYKIVNERIIKLKKFEFDFINLNEFLKNYLVSQEKIIKLIFSNNKIIEFQPIEDLYKILEDCLNFKIDEMNDDIIFMRKVLLKFLKNQKNCLGLSLEYVSRQ